MADPNRRTLGQQMLRGVGLFQILVCLPTLVILGSFAYFQLLYISTFDRFYYFVADSLNALFAAGIVFIVYLQRRAVLTPFLHFVFEGVKSGLATAMWVWLILDSAFGPWKRYYGYPPDRDLVEMRIARAALASILLLILFYPPLVYSYYVWVTEEARGAIRLEDAEGEEGV